MWPCFFILFLFKLKLGRSVEPGVDCLYGAQKDCSPELSKEMFDETAKSVFQILISTGKEWWPTEGTAMGILRYGQNFDLSNYSFSPIGTDTDIDVMIRVDDDAEWENLKKKLEEQFKNVSKHYRWCGINTAAEEGDKLSCWTDYTMGGMVIHTDIHRYQVSDKYNYAFMTHSTTLKYPFQKWKNKMVYKGGIADENGMLGVALYDNMPIPCALNIVAMLGRWNGEEYDIDDVRWPRGGLIKNGTHFKWNYNAVVITENDKVKLRNLWKDLDSKGYLSLIENDQQVKRWNIQKMRAVEKHNVSTEKEPQARRRILGKKENMKDEILMVVLINCSINLITVIVLAMILCIKSRKLLNLF